MSREALLQQRIDAVTRADLVSARFPLPHLEQIVREIAFVRIERLGESWNGTGASASALFDAMTENLVSGFYALRCPWAFLVRGTAREISCWYGLRQRTANTGAIRSLIAGVYPDVRFGKEPIEQGAWMRPPLCVALTGTPSRPDAKEQRAPEQIEQLCRGLFGCDWTFFVLAEPAPDSYAASTIEQLTHEIRDAHATFLLRASPIDEQDRTARRYIELLEAKLKRCERGGACGLWLCQAYLCTENPETLARGKALLYSAFSGPQSMPEPVRISPCDAHAAGLPRLEPLGSNELASVIRPPRESYPGYELSDSVRFGVQPSAVPAVARDAIVLGEIVDRGTATGNELAVQRRELTKHGLVVGVTGSGKTNTCIALLDQVWAAGRGSPFLVIESAKSEYRTLVNHPRFSGINVFTVGDETISPFRLNPFEAAPGVLIQAHIDYLNSLFQAAFVLFPPMPYVLSQSIQEIYQDRGWDLARNVNRRDTHPRMFPTLSDLARKISVVIDRMGYDDRIRMDVRAGLLARVNQLRIGGGKGLMLDTLQSIPAPVLFDAPCLVELKQVVSDSEKAFVIGLLLIRLYEHCETLPAAPAGPLRHVTLIEEAHRLLRNVPTGQGSEVTANPQGHAIEVFANILSEIRAYGEGILIAEQIPQKLAPDAIKNTNLKIIHRLVAEDDRRLVGTAAGLDERQIRQLSKLSTGEAVSYTEGMDMPCLLTVRLMKDQKFVPVSAAALKKVMEPFWKKHPHLLEPYAGCTHCACSGSVGGCSVRSGAVVGDLLLRDFRRLLNAMRFKHEIIPDAYNDFHARCKPGAGARPDDEVYCQLVELIERSLEHRGEFGAWPHPEVEGLIEDASVVAAVLRTHFGKLVRGSLGRHYARPASAFAAACRRLNSSSMFPFTGCSLCRDHCQFRFDMTQVSGAGVRDFWESFEDARVPMADLAEIALHESAWHFDPRDGAALQAGAFCFAVQQFAAMDLAARNQLDMARRILKCIAARVAAAK